MSSSSVPSQNGHLPADLLSSAITMHQSGHLGEAALLYEQVLARDEANASALHLLGVLNHQQGDDARAIAMIGRALALRPSMPLAHANLAEAYRCSGQPERAVGCCRLALKLWPDCPEALCNLGMALQARGRREEAVEQFRRRSEYDPTSRHSIITSASYWESWASSTRPWNTFAAPSSWIQPFAGARTTWARCSWTVANPRKPCRTFRKQPGCSRMCRPCTITSARLPKRLRDRVDARAAYLEALRLDPDFAPAHARLGVTLQREGQLGDALPWLKQAAELDPERAGLQKLLGDLFVEWGEPAEAVPILERALDLATDDRPAHHLSLAQRYYRMVGWTRPESISALRCGCIRILRLPTSTQARSTKCGVSWPTPRPHFARPCASSPGFHWRMLDSRPFSEANYPTKISPRSRKDWATHSWARSRAPGSCLGWRMCSTRGVNLPAPQRVCRRRMRWRLERLAAAGILRQRIMSPSLTGWSRLLAATFSGEWTVQVWQRSGRCSSSACRAQGPR